MSATAVPLVLPFDLWPVADREAWAAILSAPDSWGAGGGPGHNWSHGTVTAYRQSYSQWLSHLVRNQPNLLESAPALRITRDNVMIYIEECRQRLRFRSIEGLLDGLGSVANALSPGQDWKWLRNVRSRIHRKALEADVKPLPDLTAVQIYKWANSRLAALRQSYLPSWTIQARKRHAVEQRMALMLLFLVCCPVRQRSLLAMTVTKHLLRDGHHYVVQFEREDMKTRRAARMPLPETLTQHFDDYIGVHRLTLLNGKTSDAFWISVRGRSLAPDNFSMSFARFVERHLDTRFRTHVLRHIAATTIAETAPEKSAIIAGILGHTTMRTADRHYIRAKARAASKDLAALVDQRRAATKARRDKDRKA